MPYEKYHSNDKHTPDGQFSEALFVGHCFPAGHWVQEVAPVALKYPLAQSVGSLL
jgi:hypothetical protein